MGRPRKTRTSDIPDLDAVTVGPETQFFAAELEKHVPLTAPGRTPIPVRILQFEQPGQEGPGLHMATSCSIAREGKPMSRHTIEYHPWYRAFKVTYTAPDRTEVAYIPEHRVVCWYPA